MATPMFRWRYLGFMALAMLSDGMIALYILAVSQKLLVVSMALAFLFQFVSLLKILAVVDTPSWPGRVIVACWLGMGCAVGSGLAVLWS